MLPTVRTMLDAAASEAVVEPHDVAADGDAASVPRVRTPASLAHRSATHLCSQVNPELGEEQAMQVDCSTQPQAARRTLSPTRSHEDGSLSHRLQFDSERCTERSPDASTSACLHATRDGPQGMQLAWQREVVDSWEDHTDSTLRIDDSAYCHAQMVTLPYGEATSDERKIDTIINLHGGSLLLPFMPEHDDAMANLMDVFNHFGGIDQRYVPSTAPPWIRPEQVMLQAEGVLSKFEKHMEAYFQVNLDLSLVSKFNRRHWKQMILLHVVHAMLEETVRVCDLEGPRHAPNEFSGE